MDMGRGTSRDTSGATAGTSAGTPPGGTTGGPRKDASRDTNGATTGVPAETTPGHPPAHSLTGRDTTGGCHAGPGHQRGRGLDSGAIAGISGQNSSRDSTGAEAVTPAARRSCKTWVRRTSPPETRAQCRTHTMHDTNTEHDFPLWRIREGLPPPTSGQIPHPPTWAESRPGKRMRAMIPDTHRCKVAWPGPGSSSSRSTLRPGPPQV